MMKRKIFTYFKLRDAADPTIGPVFSGSSSTASDGLQKANQASTSVPEGCCAYSYCIYGFNA